MALNLDALRAVALRTEHAWTQKDTILYALGAGVGVDDPVSPATLRFAYEERLEALPTMSTIIAYPGFWIRDPLYGATWTRLLHGEQSIVLHRPLPAQGAAYGITRVDCVIDKGPERGAIVRATREIYDAGDGTPLASVRMASFLRADGGQGGFGEQPEHALGSRPEPSAPPRHVIDMPTRPEQALLYRLSGDFNPLHADPEVARAGGFERPILHGLCTYALAGRALLHTLCDNDPRRLQRMDVRFASPVYPGETLRVEIWPSPDGAADFRAVAVERDTVVLRSGYAEVLPPGPGEA